MWDLPGPGLESVSPALAGGFLTTVPPGKPKGQLILIMFYLTQHIQNIILSTSNQCKKLLMRYFTFFFFVLTHPNSDQPHFVCSVAPCGPICVNEAQI